MDSGEVSQDILDQIRAADEASGSSTVKICPHCTFENTHSRSDCDVCGLPL